MKVNVDKIEFLVNPEISISDMQKLKPLPIFSSKVVEFIEELSKEIFKEGLSKEYSDLISFGYFCRKSNLKYMKDKYKNSLETNIGRGLSFHISPSNVPLNFAYSLIVGLLSGNSCIVRAPSKGFAQTKLLCTIIEKVLNRLNGDLKSYIAIINYEKNSGVTEYISKLCNCRVIWGGDRTISDMRKIEIPPRSLDVVFADRHSLCVLNAKKIINDNSLNELCLNFYNDAYMFDQNACTSPRLVVWIGEYEEIEEAKKVFWDLMYRVVSDKYTLDSSHVINKFTNLCVACCKISGLRVANELKGNYITRVKINELCSGIFEYVSSGGFFYECDCTSLEDINCIITEKAQTLSYYGVDSNEILSWVKSSGLKGIDRVVPVGKASEFSLKWDGYDLILHLSRICDVQ
ncbi:MAG: acyl-CoA reductase [Clostridium sp.]